MTNIGTNLSPCSFFTLLSMVIQMMAWISEEGVARDIHDKKADFARPSAETGITEGNSAV